MAPHWPQVDWAQPWLVPWRERGESLLEDARGGGLVAALNAALARTAPPAASLAVGRVRFVAQGELPRGEDYEAFIGRTACVPTRDNLHDLFNGLAWLAFPGLKRRLNELQCAQISAAAAGMPRGAVRDALTLFDENAALWPAPPVLAEALRRRDWQALFVTHRDMWSAAQPLLFGHALLEKLVQPRKPITAHVWLLPEDAEAQSGVLATLSIARLVCKPFLPLPVLGIPGWWPGNAVPGFYDDAAVFRHANENGGPRAAV